MTSPPISTALPKSSISIATPTPSMPWVPVLIFLLGLCLAVAAAISKHNEINLEAEKRFKQSSDRVVEHISARMHHPVYGLQGARGLYAASKRVDRSEFRAYVESRNMVLDFVGVRGFGFVKRVLRPNLAAFIAAERADGAPNFALRELADPSHDDLYIVKFIEPAENNAGALGLDIGSEANRRDTLLRAIDSGLPTITAAITLVQDQKMTPGVLLFMPVYVNGAPPTTIAGRRASLLGVLGAPLVMSELLGDMTELREGLIDFELFDGPVTLSDTRGGALLFDADKHTAALPNSASTDQSAVAGRHFSTTRTLPLYGRDLSLRINSTATFDAGIDHSTPWLLFWGGLLLSAMMSRIWHQQSTGRRSAEVSAKTNFEELQVQKYALDQHAIVASTDVQGKITYVNDKFCEISGYSREDLMGQDHKMLNSGTHPRGFFKGMYRTVASGKTWRDEICNRAKDGHLYWVDTTIVPVIGSDGTPTRYLAIRADITPRKQAELDLKHQKFELELQKYALDQHAIVATTDVQGKITYVNDKFCEISGYSRDELMGQDHKMLNSGTHPHGFFKAMYRTVATGKTWHNEVCNTSKDGHLYWVDTTIVPVMDSEGKPERYLSIRADITLRKQVELDLVEQQVNLEKRVQQKTKAAVQSEQHLRLVMNTSLDAIVGMDAKGSVTEWSSQAERTFGWTFAEMTGQPLHNFIIPERYREAHQKGLAHYLASGVGPVLGKRIELFALHRNGTEFPIELAISPIVTPQGTSFSAFISDVTQRKQEQAALIAAKALAESASRAKSEFLANMSHEIRTPMNGVVGMVDILQESALLPEQRRMLGTIQKSSMALLQILNDILDFSKIEAGKLEVENVPVHLREVAEGVTQLMVSLPGAQAEVSLFVSTQLPHRVLGDPSRLRQVLLNLLGNAIKFSKQHALDCAEVSLSVTPCVLSDGADGVRFDIADNGIGMAPEVVAKLFQPFTQADESTARKFGGTGLGLSISQRLVELMGGRISVRSTLGEGSEFTVELPLFAAQEERALAVEPSLAGKRVLIVSRNTFGIEVRNAYCEHAGAQVSVVPDVASAREFFANVPPGQHWVILVDRLVTLPTGELGLGAAASVVREATRGTQTYPDDIVLSVRPMLRQDLMRAIASACDRFNGVSMSDHPDVAVERRSHQRLGAPTVEQAVQAGCLILLAEDNETNRDVMKEQLHLLGYTCEVAEDGAIALQMWQAQPGRYALLLSDCHMPRLDGFGLTAAIRAQEPAGTRLPIVAVTANAMQGEAQRCHAQGMDDYLSKPLRMHELRSKLEKWLPPKVVLPEFAIFNPSTLTELVGDNPSMHRRLLEKFLVNAEKQVTEISAAAAAMDASTLAGVAHTLKSAARSVGALALGELCQQLEAAGRAGDAAQCNNLAAGLAGEFAATATAINSHLGP